MIPTFSKFLAKTLTNCIKFGYADSITAIKREKQARIAKKLREKLDPTYLQVTDTTLGGASCGQMYKIIIESAAFEGKPRVAQHQMVSELLKQELQTIHAFNLKTSIPKKVESQPAKEAEKQNQELKTTQN